MKFLFAFVLCLHLTLFRRECAFLEDQARSLSNSDQSTSKTFRVCISGPARIILPTKDQTRGVCVAADVHMLLADLASEQESFEEALTDLRKALSLLQPVVQVSHFTEGSRVSESAQVLTFSAAPSGLESFVERRLPAFVLRPRN